MSGVNRGKQFELKFKEDWERTFGKYTIDRLYDSVSGYKAISNISDFIGYKFPHLFYLECKSVNNNTFPFQNLTQYDKLLPKVGLKGVRVGVVIWFKDHDKVWYVPISTISKMKQDGKKSVNVLKSQNEGYNIIEIPSVKKRVFMDSDYSVLLTLEEGM